MADIEKVIKGLKCCTSNCCMTIKCDECPYGNICYREGRCGTMMLDALELLKSQQAEIDRLKAEKNRVIEQIESEIHRVLRECGGVKDDVGKAQYQWLINGYQSALDMIKDGEQET